MDKQYRRTKRFLGIRRSPFRFTILELLVVIGIISVLATLLLPALSKARGRARYARWLDHRRSMQLDEGSTAYYTFNAEQGTSVENFAVTPNFYDTVPELYTGTLSSATGGPTWVSGRWDPKPALEFDGVNDYVSIGTLHVVPSTITIDTMSIAAWFKGESFVNADAQILSKATTSNLDDHWFALGTVESGGEIRLSFRLKTGGVTSELIASSGGLQVDAWTLAVATYDGDTMRIYKNGEPVGSMAKSGNIDTNDTVAVRIGANPENSKYFHGVIDEVALMNRDLSAVEVRNYYLMGNP